MKQNSTVTLFHSFNYMPLRKATQLLPSHIFAVSSADRLYHFTCLDTNERERIIPLQLGIAFHFLRLVLFKGEYEIFWIKIYIFS